MLFRSFVSHIDVPYKANDDATEHYVEQIECKVLNKLKENFGVDISEDSMRKAVEIHNEVCRLITQIGEFRKEDNPRITGYEFHILNLITYVCPKYLIVEKLRETLDEIKHREPDAEKKFRAKVVLVGSEIDDPDLTRLIEDAGALIVADRFCFGSFPGRQEIVLKDNEPVMKSICRQYLDQSQCPRYVTQEKKNQRWDFAESLYKDYHADGIIYEQIQFCDYWCYERALASHIMTEERGIPTLSIDRPYMSRTSGQLRTRVQAFVESLEIKKIQKDRKKEA